MSNIDKKWLQQTIADMEAARDEIPFGLDEDDSNTLAALRIALASLEAEAVGYMNRFTGRVFTLEEQPGADTDVQVYVPVYTAPPATANAEPVAWIWSHRKHPSEVALVRPEDDEKAEAAQWSGWSYKALYADPPVAAAPDYPCVLPCPVMLEPGLRFGKGVPTKAMLGALQRRSEYYAELDAMTPEQRAEHDAGMREFSAMLQSFGNSEQLNSPVIQDGSEDTKRLDWLEAQNKRLNEYYGTTYGWKFDANFQRNAMMLNDSNYPVMTVRQAIDEAIAAAPQQEVKS